MNNPSAGQHRNLIHTYLMQNFLLELKFVHEVRESYPFAFYQQFYVRHWHPLNPHVFNNPARGSNGHQQPFGDAIKVAERLVASPGSSVSIRLADILPGWPYRFPGLDNWLNEVKSFINDKKHSGLTNWYGYEIWNEPDGTWKDPNGLNFNLFWKQTYDVIKQNNPDEKIIGP